MELYINDIQVDLNDRLPFPLNFQISEIKDLSKRKGSSSKTITLPGTQNNVKLMSGVFVVSATKSVSGNSTSFNNFDPTIKATARYYQNGILQFNGICQLRDCIKIGSDWQFEIVLFQESIDIVKLLSNYKLNELGWSEYNHTLNKTNQSNSWDASIIKDGVAYSNITGTEWDGEGYYYGLIDYGFDRPALDTFRVEDLAPQIFVKNIIDKMFEKIGVTIDSDFFDTHLFRKLLLAYEGGEFPSVDSATSTANSIETDWLTDASGEVLNTTQQGVEIADNYFGFNNNLYNLFYQSNSATDVDPSNLIQSQVPLKFVAQIPGLYKLNINGSIKQDLDFTVTGSTDFVIDWTREIKVTIFKNGNIYRQDFLHPIDIVVSTSLTNTFTVTGAFEFDLQLETIDLIEVRFGFTNTAFVLSNTLGMTAATSNLVIEPTIGLDITLDQVSITEGSTVNIKQFLPEKMTCADFFKGIVNMFNLIVKPSEDNPKVLEVEPLDDFYLGTQSLFGNDLTLDLTELVDRSQEWRVTPTINFASKEYVYRFDEGKDYFNNRYVQDVNKNYGAKNIQSSSEFSTGETEQKLPFTTIPISNDDTTNLIIPRSYQSKSDAGGFATIKPQKNKAFICQVSNLDAGTLVAGDWKHQDNAGIDTVYTTYPYVGHVDNPLDPTFDLLFEVPDYINYDLIGGTSYTTNNLYLYHEKSLKELIDRNGKLLTCYVKLNSSIINNLDFRRLIKIDGVVYKLNKIENYESSREEPTKIELIKIIGGSNVQNYNITVPDKNNYTIANVNVNTGNIPIGDVKRSLGVDSNGYLVKSAKHGSGLTSGDVVFVNQKSDFPEPTAGKIFLEANKTYFIYGDIDLTGDRIETTGTNAIIGTSSETSSITSTGLGVDAPLITSDYTLVLQNITIKNVGKALDIDGLGNEVALDWLAVNFLNVTTIGLIKDVRNFIYTSGAFLNAQRLSFDGTIGTISFFGSFLLGTAANAIIRVLDTAIITRRFRIAFSTVNAGTDSLGIDVDARATIPNEGFILETVNFEGAGTYLTGLDYQSNKASFKNNTGIVNSDEIAQYYMNGNTTATTITTIGTSVKVAGTTTAAALNQKFNHTDNRATYVGSRTRFFKVTATLSVDSGNNNQVGIYIAKNGTLLTESEIYVTTNAGGRAENGMVQTLVELAEDDYIELFVENDTSKTDVTVTELNVIIE